MDISILTTGITVSTGQVESHGLICNVMPVQTTSMKKQKQLLTICLSEKAERLCISAMLWVVLQLRQTAGSAMRPRSTSTRVLNAHTWQRKNASCISGISWEVRITIPLIVMSWSISESKQEMMMMMWPVDSFINEHRATVTCRVSYLQGWARACFWFSGRCRDALESDAPTQSQGNDQRRAHWRPYRKWGWLPVRTRVTDFQYLVISQSDDIMNYRFMFLKKPLLLTKDYLFV